MDENKWLRRKPQSNLDYLGITLIAVAFYVALLNAQSFLNGVNRILGILAPFAGGVVIAYCLNPIVKAAMKYLFRGREKCRGLAILLAYIVGLAIVVLLMVLIIPQMVASVVMFYQNFDGYAQNLLNMLKELDAETPGVDLSLAVTTVENLNASMSDLLGTIVKAITNRAPQIISYVGGVASGVVTVFTAIASSVYLLLQKDKLLRHARVLTRAFLPKSAAETTLRICHDANRNFGGFFAGKILDSAIIGVLTFVSMNILGLSYTTLISIIVGITNIIPVFGPFIGAIPGAVILLFLDPWQALIFLILILIIQQLDGNFIGPMILGDSIGISALWVLFAIVVGGDLFGLVGMVVGVPIFATIYGILRTAARHGLRQKGYTDVEESVSASAAGDEIPDDPRESGRRVSLLRQWKEKIMSIGKKKSK